MEEDYLRYCEDIETENSSSDEYENRLEEEIAEADCETKEDYIEYLCRGYSDSVEWFKDSFGEDMLNDAINKYNLLDIPKVIDYIKEEAGRGILASWNGIEEEEGEYFIYRLN